MAGRSQLRVTVRKRRDKTGGELGRKEPHSEGVANHADLESCAGDGDIAGEALTEALAGRPLSRERLSFGRRPCGQKGKATSRVALSQATCEPGAVGRTRARQETLRARTGRPPRRLRSRPVGEGQGRTTHVYGAEESEWAIVPAKDSNKDEKSLAESLEGRACTKENVRCAAHRPHTEAGSGDTVADERASGDCVVVFRSPSSEVGAV